MACRPIVAVDCIALAPSSGRYTIVTVQSQ